MKVSKKIISLIMVVLLIGAAFVMPLSVNALNSSAEINIMDKVSGWEAGLYKDTDGTKQNNSKWFRSKDFIDVHTYSNKITIGYNRVEPYIWRNIYYYNKNKQPIMITGTNPLRCSAYTNTSLPNSESSVYTLPSDCYYINVGFYLHSESNAASVISSYTPRIYINANPLVDTSQIDANKTGSLKIHKYEMNDTSTANTNGTGYSTDVANVPSGAKALNGVTFTVKKVADIGSTYYTRKGITLPTATTAASMAVLASYTKTTAKVGNDDGIALFEDLPLGIYLVQETSAPNHVTAPVDDFVVSIPSTSSDGTSWNYDLSVFPKNKTSYANFQIEKVDKADANTKLSGAIFSLAKSEDNSNFTWIEDLTTNTNGIATPTKSLPVNCYYRLRENTTPTGYIKDVANNNNDTYFYLDENSRILSRDKSTVINVPSNGNPAVITINNTKPTIEKFIDRSRGKNTNLTKNDTSLVRYNDDNDFQYYTVAVTTPAIDDMSKLKTFQVKDVFYNTAIQPVINSVTSNGSAIDSNAYTFTATTTSAESTWNKFYTTNVTFDTSKLSPNTTYYISYKAYVVDTQANKASVIYSQSTSSSETATNTIDSNTVKFVRYRYQFTKKDGNKNNLAGAVFSVYNTKDDAEANKNPIKMRLWGSLNGAYTATSGSDGIVNLNSFDMDDAVNGEKTFWLAEIKAPKGFSLLAEPVEITVTANSGASSQMDIINTNNLAFPYTGSIGIAVFIIIGCIFIIGGIVFVRLRKNKKLSAKE